MSSNNSDALQVVFASAEAAPFVKTGGLGDVAGSLPQALQAAGVRTVVMVPKYDTIAQEFRDSMDHLGEFYVPLGWRNEYCGIERLVWHGVTYLFIDNERYFARGYPYGFFDDGERFAFFSKAVVESLQHLPHMLGGFSCNVLHCNDWHTAMAPVFLREFYQQNEMYRNVRCVFSIHNIAFQGQFSATVLHDILGLAHIPAAAFQLTCGPDAINYMQGALNYTDAITTVSPTYAEEIKTPAFGEGLDGILCRRAPILQGIVNGIDTDGFNPATDTRIAATFTAHDRSGKAVCKAELQRELGLEVRDDRPLMVMVTRLTRQKGMDLVTYALDRILSGGVQVAVLGTGDTEYENALRYFGGKYPGTMAARIQFDPALSQRMYAGADLFLMPSLFEPCGLSQMIAMRYGTLPIVRETGGLKDTVAPYNQFTGEGTGFSFANFNGDEMGDAVFRAARLFWDDRAAFDKLVDHAMTADFSWKRSADMYVSLYHNLHPELPRPIAPSGQEASASNMAAPTTDPEATTRTARKAQPKATSKTDAKTTTKAARASKPKAAPDAESKATSKASPTASKVTSKAASATVSKTAPQTAPDAAPKAAPKAAAKKAPKAAPAAAAKKTPKASPKVAPAPAPKTAPKVASIVAPSPESKDAPKATTKPAPKPASDAPTAAPKAKKAVSSASSTKPAATTKPKAKSCATKAATTGASSTATAAPTASVKPAVKTVPKTSRKTKRK